MTKQLEKQFEGRGEVRGYSFKQLFESEKAYLYQLTDNETGSVHYEVFKKVENKQFDCISYPRSNSFGVWAWCFKSKVMAWNRYVELNQESEL